MSRNRNRRRLRELCQRDPAPLLYTCTSAESIRRSLPPDVWDEAGWEGRGRSV